MKTKLITKMAAVAVMAAMPTVLLAGETPVSASTPAARQDATTQEGYYLRDGRLVELREGRVTEVEKDVELEDGTRVDRQGRIVRKDGSKVKFEDGNILTRAGQMVPRIETSPGAEGESSAGGVTGPGANPVGGRGAGGGGAAASTTPDAAGGTTGGSTGPGANP